MGSFTTLNIFFFGMFLLLLNSCGGNQPSGETGDAPVPCNQKNLMELKEHCPHTPEWLKSAQVSNEVISVNTSGDVTWYNGTWTNGTWKNGTWKKGTWTNGTWENGFWESGTWHNGTWYAGVWQNGTWRNGTWAKGTWLAGNWENGSWRSGTWKGGTWKGTFKGPNFNPENP